MTVFRTLLMVSLVLPLAGNGLALEILYPLDGAYVTKSNYLIIKGGQDPYLEGMTIEINGVKSDVLDISGEKYRALFDDMLLLEPSFDPGENKIVVEGYLNGEKFDEAEANIYYKADVTTLPPAGYDKDVFHVKEREQGCSECHNMEPNELVLSAPDARRNPCGSCHARMLNKEHVHGPAGVFDCTYCHDVDSSPVKYQARLTDGSLCLECHEGFLGEVSEERFVHGPVEAGLCLACHDAHATDQAAQVIFPVNELCLSCHDKVTQSGHVLSGFQGKPHPLEGPVDPVREHREFNCASCHEPHVAVSKALFRGGVTSRMQLCTRCHDK